MGDLGIKFWVLSLLSKHAATDVSYITSPKTTSPFLALVTVLTLFLFFLLGNARIRTGFEGKRSNPGVYLLHSLCSLSWPLHKQSLEICKPSVNFQSSEKADPNHCQGSCYFHEEQTLEVSPPPS